MATILISPFTVAEPLSSAEQAIERLADNVRTNDDRAEAIQQLRILVENEEIGLQLQQRALVTLGNLEIQELSQYYFNIAMGHYEITNVLHLRSLAYRAYWKTRLSTAGNDTEASLVLEEALHATVGGLFFGHVRSWAISELCRRGSAQHFPKIVEAIKSLRSGERAQAEVDLCEKQISILSEFDNRIDALAHVVLVENPLTDGRFVDWALKEFINIAPAQSEHLLRDYILRLQNDLKIVEEDHVYRYPFYFLRQQGWTDEQFREVAIEPIRWFH